MPTFTTPSFRRMAAESLHVEWHYRDTEGTYHVWPNSVDSWDPDAPVHVVARIGAERTAVEQHTGVGPEADLRAGLSWYCPTTQVRGSGQILALRGSPDDSLLELHCEVPGHQLGGAVEFRAAIVLAAPSCGAAPLTARRPGSILWEARQRLTLEGAGGRFPMVWVDFASSPGFADGAAWSLEWDNEALEEPVLRGPRLYLNQGHEKLRAAVDQPSSEAARNILEMLYFDVGRILITGTLRNEEFVADPEGYERGTVGHAVNHLISNVFPGFDPAQLADRLEHEPTRFERELQHGMRVLRALESR